MTDVMLLSQNWKNIGTWMRRAVVCCMLLGIIIIDVSGFSTIWKTADADKQVIEKCLELADEHEMEDVIVVDDRGAVARKMAAIDIDKNVQFAMIDEDNGTIGFITWGVSSNTSVNASNIMLVRENDLPRIPADIREAYLEIGAQDEWHILMTSSHAW